MEAVILRRPDTFDRVDRVKSAIGQRILPGDDGLWILGGPLEVVVNDAEYITVPKGFTTDGASIPTVAQWITGWRRWDEPQRWGAIVHDWLYTQPGVIRKRADRVFRALLESEDTPMWEAEIMFLAVRVGGGWAFRADQEHGAMIYQ